MCEFLKYTDYKLHAIEFYGAKFTQAVRLQFAENFYSLKNLVHMHHILLGDDIVPLNVDGCVSVCMSSVPIHLNIDLLLVSGSEKAISSHPQSDEKQNR